MFKVGYDFDIVLAAGQRQAPWIKRLDFVDLAFYFRVFFVGMLRARQFPEDAGPMALKGVPSPVDVVDVCPLIGL